jgi:hypothetical protein
MDELEIKTKGACMNDSKHGQDVPEPGKNELEKILKEKFGDPDFGGLMNSIVEQMLKDLGGSEGKGKKGK